jgi:XTP/dITP diphosphohydrolase
VPRTILIASFNRGKVREIQESLSSALIDCLSLDAIPQMAPCVESGSTFEENARQKAIYYSRSSPWLTLADDSGLVVDALDGAPGVRSARFLSDSASDEERCREVLRRLTGVPASRCSARFICIMALALKGEVKAVLEGKVEGSIADTPAGRNGFGYDPIFLIPGLEKTMAELTSTEKLAISHRGQALRKLKEVLAAPGLLEGSWPTHA